MTDCQLKRLSLTTEELDVARKIMEMIKPLKGDEDTLVPTKYRDLASEKVLKRVRGKLTEAKCIRPIQRGGIKKLLELPV